MGQSHLHDGAGKAFCSPRLGIFWFTWWLLGCWKSRIQTFGGIEVSRKDLDMKLHEGSSKTFISHLGKIRRLVWWVDHLDPPRPCLVWFITRWIHRYGFQGSCCVESVDYRLLVYCSCHGYSWNNIGFVAPQSYAVRVKSWIYAWMLGWRVIFPKYDSPGFCAVVTWSSQLSRNL